MLIYSTIMFAIFFPCLFLLITGKVTLALSGFALDSTGKLYLGKDAKIEVYENNTLKYAIPKMPRAYVFTIQPDDTILLVSSEKVYVLDLQGKDISERDDTKAYNRMKSKMKTFYSSDGTQYVLWYPWSRAEIIRGTDGALIYRTPTDEFVYKILIIISFIGVFFANLFLVLYWRKSNDKLK